MATRFPTYRPTHEQILDDEKAVKRIMAELAPKAQALLDDDRDTVQFWHILSPSSSLWFEVDRRLRAHGFGLRGFEWCTATGGTTTSTYLVRLRCGLHNPTKGS